MLPNFLIIGAAKAGTTSLYHYVRSHPQAFMPERKELSFFCEEFNWKRGVEWYESHFRGAASAVAVGEASPRYTVYPLYRDVPARIASLIPGLVSCISSASRYSVCSRSTWTTSSTGSRRTWSKRPCRRTPST